MRRGRNVVGDALKGRQQYKNKVCLKYLPPEMKSTKVQTLGELRMCGTPKIDGLGCMRLLVVSRE